MVHPDAIISNINDLVLSPPIRIINPAAFNSLPNLDINSLILPHVNGESLAYIIFTSGSTGTPKGVKVTRDNLFCYLDWCTNTLPFVETKNVLQTASIAFDLSVLSIFPPIIANSTLVSLKVHKERFIPWEVISSENINVIVSVPSFLALIMASGCLDHQYFDSESIFIFCGEPLTCDLTSKIFSAIDRSIVWNLYGPTEVTVSCSGIKLTSDIFEKYSDGRFLSIGKPNPGHTFNIQSHADKLGVLKDSLFVTGPQVSNGYFGFPDLTSKFYEYSDCGSLTYNTGDEVYKRSDGYYFFKRRIDRQIKISGYRIELEEIESKVLGAGADEAIAVSKNTFIQVTYFSKNNLSSRELSGKLLEQFPPYYRLKFVRSDTLLKRTLNGKLDLKFYENSA